MPLLGLSWLLKRIVWDDPSLRRVNLSGQRIGVDGAKSLAEALRGNTVVTELYLCGNSIGDEGARALAEALEVNSITRLYLTGNSIGDDGASALAEALKKNSSVTELNLDRNNIGAEGETALAEALELNSSIRRPILRRVGPVGWNGVSDEYEQRRVFELIRINNAATNSEDARRLKIVWKVGRLLNSEVDAETAAAVDLALDQLGSFPEAAQRRGLFEKLLVLPEHGADVAASVDVATARILYWCAADCGAAPSVLVNLMRAHPSLCACRDVKHNLYPFMLLATMAEAGVGDVLELLLLNPNLVESGIV